MPSRLLLPVAALLLGACAMVVNPVSVANQWLPDGFRISEEGTVTVYLDGVLVSVLAPEGLARFPLDPGVYGPGDIDDLEQWAHEMEHHVQIEFGQYEYGTADDEFEFKVRGQRVALDGGVLRIGDRTYGAVSAGDEVVIAHDYVTVNGYLRGPQATIGRLDG